MSKRIVDDPSLHGWVEEDGKWVWDGKSPGSIEDGDIEGQIATWSGAEWTPEGAVVVDATGNVGIGGAPKYSLTVADSVSCYGDSTTATVAAEGGKDLMLIARSGQGMSFRTGGGASSSTRLTIDATGNVGIGMSPTRSTAKEQLAEWKSRFDARLKAEPKADKKAVTLEITDDAFEVLPTEEALSEWMETRGAGDKLQVSGNISASTVTCGAGARFQVGDEKTYLAKGTIESAGGTALGSNNGFLLLNNGFDKFMPSVTAQCSIGGPTQQFKNGFFSGTVNANKFVGDGSGLTGVGGGLPDGDFTHNGKITATDFIATSDERVKDNITTAPVGLIDSLKGREWDWAESGEKGSGVVAQELEQVLPHLVHEDDDGMKSVSYNGLVAYLIEEVKALKAEVEALKS